MWQLHSKNCCFFPIEIPKLQTVNKLAPNLFPLRSANFVIKTILFLSLTSDPSRMNESIPIIHFCWARRHGESRRQKEQRATRSRFKQPTLHKCVVYHYFHLFVLFITTFTTLHVPCPLQKLTPSHTNAELK